MRYLIGLSGENTKEEKQFYSNLKLIFKPFNLNLTEAYSVNSLLSYLAIEDYDAIWVRWHVLKKYFRNFCHRLESLHKNIPLIILNKGDKITGEIIECNEMLFSIAREDNLTETIPKLVERIQLFNQFKSENSDIQKKLVRPNGYGSFVGNDAVMLKLYSQISRVAKTNFSVLILGQSGSGKEIVAKSIHQLSRRTKAPFVSLNCAAIPENLLESELFGYEKGAYTGAQKAKEGKFESANKGTIFLDEIGDLALPLQGKLLRVLEDHTIERLGGTTTIKVDIRLIAATNKDLNKLTSEGKFRNDLFHRLNVIPLKLIPIRDRGDDIDLLILHLIAQLTKDSELKIKSVSFDLIDKIKKLSLQGNVRELENILTRLIFYSESLNLTEADLEDVPVEDNYEVNFSESEISKTEDKIISLKALEKKAIADALVRFDGHITNVANALEISRGTLYNKIKEYDLS